MNSSCYCHSLRKATRRMTALYDAALQPIGVNLAQFSLLRNIARHAPLSLTELGQLTELDRSTIGRNVKVLERLGLTQAADAEDQREANVELTPKGRQALGTAIPLWEDVQHRIETRLGAGNAAQLETLLAAI